MLPNLKAPHVREAPDVDAVEEMPGLYMQLVMMTMAAGVILIALARPLKRLAQR